ncbi:MAG: endonuclease III [Spirochaetota bacterium]
MKADPNNIEWDAIIKLLKKTVSGNALPSVSQIANRRADPFRILISTMISLRTKDEVTLPASERLFERASTSEEIAGMDEKTIANLIYPAGFYKTKAKNIKKTAEILAGMRGVVPASLEKLLQLPGVGRKTGNLVLNLGYGIDAICVDTHVHRISNRMGWVETKTPAETEVALMAVLPKKYWITINEVLVSYGQKICTPQSPFCSKCSLIRFCERKGVLRSR